MRYWLILPLIFVSLPLQAEIYKCRQPNGNTEISNSPCSGGSSTVKTVNEEFVPEENRRQAEQNVEQMRMEAEKLEASRRADQAIERKQQEKQQAARQQSGPSTSAVQDCLRTLERLTVDAARRAELEASCLSSGTVQPVYSPTPYYIAPIYNRPVQRPIVKPAPLPQPRNNQIEPAAAGFTPPPGNLRPR